MFTPQSGNRDRSFRHQNVPFLPPDTVLPAQSRGKFTVAEKESPLRADSAELRRVCVSATPSPQGESLDPAAASAAGALPSTRLFATPGPHTDTHSNTHSYTHTLSHTQRSSPSPLSLATPPLSSLPARSPHSAHSSQGSRTARKTSPGPQRFQYTPPAADFMAQVASLFDDDEDHQDALSSSPSPPISPAVSVSVSLAADASSAGQSQSRKHDAVPTNATTHVVIPTSAPVWRETSPSSPPSSSEHKLVFTKRSFPPPPHDHNLPQSSSPQRALPPFDGETSERDAERSLSGSDADDFDDRYYRQLRDRLSQMYTPLITQPEAQAKEHSHTPLLSSLLHNAQQEIEQVQRTQTQMQTQTSPAQKKIDTLLQSLLTRIEQSGERDREQESVDPEVDRQAQELLRFESLARRPTQALGATGGLSSALETELLGPEVQTHLAFLRSLDDQFGTSTDDPQRLLEKFLLLPVGEVQSLVFRQHDELVARGIFDEKNILTTWIS